MSTGKNTIRSCAICAALFFSLMFVQVKAGDDTKKGKRCTCEKQQARAEREYRKLTKQKDQTIQVSRSLKRKSNRWYKKTNAASGKVKHVREKIAACSFR